MTIYVFPILPLFTLVSHGVHCIMHALMTMICVLRLQVFLGYGNERTMAAARGECTGVLC